MAITRQPILNPTTHFYSEIAELRRCFNELGVIMKNLPEQCGDRTEEEINKLKEASDFLNGQQSKVIDVLLNIGSLRDDEDSPRRVHISELNSIVQEVKQKVNESLLDDQTQAAAETELGETTTRLGASGEFIEIELEEIRESEEMKKLKKKKGKMKLWGGGSSSNQAPYIADPVFLQDFQSVRREIDLLKEKLNSLKVNNQGESSQNENIQSENTEIEADRRQETKQSRLVVCWKAFMNCLFCSDRENPSRRRND